MRTLIDNRYIRRHRGLSTTLRLIASTCLHFCANLVVETAALVRARLALLRTGMRAERRNSRRHRPRRTSCLLKVNGDDPVNVEIVDMSHQALRLRVPAASLGHDEVSLCFVHRKNGRTGKGGRLSRVHCSGRVERSSLVYDSGDVLVGYKPRSEFDRYKLEKYVLRSSFG
jgi:hypothetical protein